MQRDRYHNALLFDKGMQLSTHVYCHSRWLRRLLNWLHYKRSWVYISEDMLADREAISMYGHSILHLEQYLR